MTLRCDRHIDVDEVYVDLLDELLSVDRRGDEQSCGSDDERAHGNLLRIEHPVT